jgi:quercetin dioxygenase-like cupin family protein
MTKRTVFAALSTVLFSSAAAIAQDPVKVGAANYKVILENAAVRVLKIDYPAGAKTAMHQHPDSIAVILTDAKMRFTTPDGKSEEMARPNESALYNAAGSHSPANIGSARLEAILIEFKTPAPGKAVLPPARPGLTMKMLAEGPRAVAYRVTSDAKFEEAAGTKHDYDQVVIALGAGDVTLAIEGQAPRQKWVRGDTMFIPRNVGHASKNNSGKPLDLIIVSIR